MIALQEVTRRSAPLWRAALGEMGFAGCETALDDALPSRRGARPLDVLTAAWWPPISSAAIRLVSSAET